MQEQPPDLEQTLTATKNLCRTIVHDFNNPLSAISGYVQLSQLRLGKLSEGDLSTLESLIEYQERIQEALDRITHMLRRLDMFSKTRLSPLAVVEPEQMIRDLLALRESSEQAKVQIQTPQTPVRVRTITLLLKQILEELLDNALWGTRNGGKVEVFFGNCTSTEVEIIIGDTGEGIPSELLSQIFLPCAVTRTNFAFPKKGNLHGLGLPIVLQLTTHLKGKFHIESSPQAGTTVRLVIPYL